MPLFERENLSKEQTCLDEKRNSNEYETFSLINRDKFPEIKIDTSSIRDNSNFKINSSSETLIQKKNFIMDDIIIDLYNEDKKLKQKEIEKYLIITFPNMKIQNYDHIKYVCRKTRGSFIDSTVKFLEKYEIDKN